MLTNITLDLHAGAFNSETMSLKVSNKGNTLFETDCMPEGKSTLNIDIMLPGELVIELGNRNDSDIEVNQDGIIVQNKHIKLNYLYVDNLCIPSYKLTNDCLLYIDQSSNKKENSTFWDANGSVTLSIAEEDPIIWWLHHPELWS